MGLCHSVEQENKCITELDMSFKYIKNFPNDIKNPHYLKKIIFNNNDIENLSDEFINLINLTEIDFSFNEIIIFPDAIDKFEELEILKLSHNKLMRNQ